jgi:hypothetical protein
MAINPGIPIPSAMPRASLEKPLNGADDGEDEDVKDCMVDGVICDDDNAVADDIADEDAKVDKVVVIAKLDKVVVKPDKVAVKLDKVVVKLDKVVVEPRNKVGAAAGIMILKGGDLENIQPSVVVLRNKKRNLFETVRLNS